MPESQRTPFAEMPSVGVPNARQVADVVAQAGTIGAASDALRAAGWENRVAGNRISVDNRVFARFVDEFEGSPRWVVYGIGEMPPVWIVGGDSNIRMVPRRLNEQVPGGGSTRQWDIT